MAFYSNFDDAMLVAKKKNRNITNVGLSHFCKSMGYKISPESIGKYRKNERTPDPEFVALAAEYLNIAEQDLFDDSERQRQKITKEEVMKDPDAWIKFLRDNISSRIMSFSDELKEGIDNLDEIYKILDAEERRQGRK